MDIQLDVTDTVSRSDLFAEIEEERLSDIVDLGRRQVHQTGITLFREGDPAVRSYLILKGSLKLSKLHEDGKEAIVRYINPGEITAAVAVSNGRTYPVTAQTVGLTEVVEWDRQTMLELITAYPRLAINMLRAAVDRLDDMQSRYLELRAERVEQRIARALLRFMEKSGRKTDQGILIDLRLSRQNLADYTGTTLYTASRTLSNWEKRGWIASGRERIVIIDPHALVTFADAG
jgi:CRP-like cAMP-binding protein